MARNKRHEKRGNGNRPRRSNGLVLMVGDGESERVYFERYSDLCTTVGIKAYALSKTGPDVILRKTKEYVRRFDLDPFNGDLVAIVMDLDDRFTKGEIADMERRCKELGYDLFLSNPSFEVWLLSHFRVLTHAYTPSELVEDLDRELGGKYSKSRGFEIDDEMVDRAIRNSRKLLPDSECTPLGCYEQNPSTMVHFFMEKVRRMLSRRAYGSVRIRSAGGDDYGHISRLFSPERFPADGNQSW